MGIMTNNDSVPQGSSAYAIGQDPCTGRGYVLATSEMSAALGGRVFRTHHMTDELGILREELANLPGTGFSNRDLDAVTSSLAGAEPWRIGESLAECWMEDNRDCTFPWNTQADMRSLRASLPGTDLIGLTGRPGESMFAFGEIKTSSDKNSPPQVVYGKKGLTFQLKNLQESGRQRMQLVQYLGLRAVGTDWFLRYGKAVANHFKSRYKYWGILLRDTPPSAADLTHTVIDLSRSASSESPVELIALYTDISVSEWPKHCRSGGAS